MYDVAPEILQAAHKPFDLVTDAAGNIGFVREVSINRSQPGGHIQYAVKWMSGDNTKVAWFDHSELTNHGNIFLAVAECACHPMGGNAAYVKGLFAAIS